MALSAPQQAAFEVVKHVLGNERRNLFFATAPHALPISDNDGVRNDHTLLQCGFVGDKYDFNGLVIVGTSPGSGSRDSQSDRDELIIPCLQKLNEMPTPEHYRLACDAQSAAFPDWPAGKDIWSRLSVHKFLQLDRLSYFNVFPYRSGSGRLEDVFPINDPSRREAASMHWVYPLIMALKPAIMIYHGKTAYLVRHSTFPWGKPLHFNMDIVYHRNMGVLTRAYNQEFDASVEDAFRIRGWIA